MFMFLWPPAQRLNLNFLHPEAYERSSTYLDIIFSVAVLNKSWAPPWVRAASVPVILAQKSICKWYQMDFECRSLVRDRRSILIQLFRSCLVVVS